MALTPREAAPGHSNTRNLPSLQPRGVWDTAIPVYTVTYSEAWLMNRAGSCAADYICVYNVIQCTRSDWERAKQESDSPSLASAETSSTGNGDQRSFCRVLLRTEANPPHTVGEGPWALPTESLCAVPPGSRALAGSTSVLGRGRPLCSRNTLLRTAPSEQVGHAPLPWKSVASMPGRGDWSGAAACCLPEPSTRPPAQLALSKHLFNA